MYLFAFMIAFTNTQSHSAQKAYFERLGLKSKNPSSNMGAIATLIAAAVLIFESCSMAYSQDAFDHFLSDRKLYEHIAMNEETAYLNYLINKEEHQEEKKEKTFILTTSIMMQINYVPGEMNSSQRGRFESQLQSFLMSKVERSSSHSISVFQIDIKNEAFIERDLNAPGKETLKTLVSEIIVTGENKSVATVSTPPTNKDFDDLVREAIEVHQDFLSLEIHYLSNQYDDYFKFVEKVMLVSEKIEGVRTVPLTEKMQKESSKILPIPSANKELNRDDMMEKIISKNAVEQSKEANNNVGISQIKEVQEPNLEIGRGNSYNGTKVSKRKVGIINFIAITAIGIGLFGSFGLMLGAVYYYR